MKTDKTFNLQMASDTSQTPRKLYLRRSDAELIRKCVSSNLCVTYSFTLGDLKK